MLSEEVSEGWFSHGLSPIVWLGYLDSNQEQLNGSEPTVYPAHQARNPRISGCSDSPSLHRTRVSPW